MRGQSLPRHPSIGGTNSSPRMITGDEFTLKPCRALFGPRAHLLSLAKNELVGTGFVLDIESSLAGRKVFISHIQIV